VDFESAPALKSKKTMGGKGPSHSTKAVRLAANNAALIDTLLSERTAGHQSDSGFKAVAYMTCVEAFRGSEEISGGCCKGRVVHR
jgi:hypothetical protein